MFNKSEAHAEALRMVKLFGEKGHLVNISPEDGYWSVWIPSGDIDTDDLKVYESMNYYYKTEARLQFRVPWVEKW